MTYYEELERYIKCFSHKELIRETKKAVENLERSLANSKGVRHSETFNYERLVKIHQEEMRIRGLE